MKSIFALRQIETNTFAVPQVIIFMDTVIHKQINETQKCKLAVFIHAVLEPNSEGTLNSTLTNIFPLFSSLFLAASEMEGTEDTSRGYRTTPESHRAIWIPLKIAIVFIYSHLEQY